MSIKFDKFPKGCLVLFIILVLSSNLLAQTEGNIKIDWVQQFEGLKGKNIKGMIPTTNNGCLLYGQTTQNVKTSYSWIAKINYMGMVEWNKINRVKEYNEINSVVQTSYGGYIACGLSREFGSSKNNIWLLKLDTRGIKEWEKTYDVNQASRAFSIKQIRDGGYAVCGETYINEEMGKNCVFLKINPKGELEWKKNYGSLGDDVGYSVIQTQDGSYAVCGKQEQNKPGDTDMWVLKLNKQGKIEWQKNFGWQLEDTGEFVFKTSGLGFAIGGYFISPEKRNKDFWVVRLDESGNELWEDSFGGFGQDSATDMIQTKQQHFVVIGNSEEDIQGNNYFWMINFNEQGENNWDQEFVGEGSNRAMFVVQSEDAGYYLLVNRKVGDFPEQVWLIKLDTQREGKSSVTEQILDKQEPGGYKGFLHIDRHLKYFFEKDPLHKQAVDSRKGPLPIYDPISHYYVRFGHPRFQTLSGRYVPRYSNKYINRTHHRYIPRFYTRVYSYNPGILDQYKTNEEGLEDIGSQPLHRSAQLFKTRSQSYSPRRAKVDLGAEKVLGEELIHSLGSSLIPIVFIWLIIFFIIIFKIIPKSR